MAELVWHDGEVGDVEVAYTDIGMIYYVSNGSYMYGDSMGGRGSKTVQKAETPEAAKAACQKHYDQYAGGTMIARLSVLAARPGLPEDVRDALSDAAVALTVADTMRKTLARYRDGLTGGWDAKVAIENFDSVVKV